MARCVACGHELPRYDPSVAKKPRKYCSQRCKRSIDNRRYKEAERMRQKQAGTRHTPIIQVSREQYDYRPGSSGALAYNGWRRMA